MAGNAGIDPQVAEAFVRVHTRVQSVPGVPELRLHLAREAFGLWQATQSARGGGPLPPPFWGFAWPGGLGLARYLLEHPETVAGRSVYDVASGSGLVAIAAARAGAARVVANELDPLAATAIRLNAVANGVELTVSLEDGLSGEGDGCEVVLAGDVFYERPLLGRSLAFLWRSRARGADVLVGDSERRYFPKTRFVQVAEYELPVSRAIEDADVKRTAVWRLKETVG